MPTLTKHPSCCPNPDTCTLTYVEHLRGFGIASTAIPTRNPTGASNITRELRWQRDMAAYKRLRADGLQPPQIDGSALRERQGQDAFDVEARKVTIDYTDPK